MRNNCVDCDKEISYRTLKYGSKKCRVCSHKDIPVSNKSKKKMSNSQKERFKNPEDHPSYKGGKPNCIDCGKPLTKYSSKRCQHCYFKWNKGVNSNGYRGGIANKLCFCVDCKTKLGKNAIYSKTKRCSSCARIHLIKLGLPCLKGKNNPAYIDGRSMVKQFCKDCKKPISKRAKRCGHCATLGETGHCYKGGKPKCKDCYKQLRSYEGIRCRICANTRESNPNWQGGISKSPYSFEFTSKLKSKIRKRDNYTCQKCGIEEKEYLLILGRKLAIHHIDYDKQNCEEENLITLCNSCNVKVNSNRDYWKKYYKDKNKCHSY